MQAQISEGVKVALKEIGKAIVMALFSAIGTVIGEAIIDRDRHPVHPEPIYPDTKKRRGSKKGPKCPSKYK